MFRLAIKVGCLTGTVYYLRKEGVWKESIESTKIYDKMYDAYSPYSQDIKNTIPFELPDLPESLRVSTGVKVGWNNGVLATTRFIKNLPCTVTNYVEKTGPEVVKFFESSKYDK